MLCESSPHMMSGTKPSILLLKWHVGPCSDYCAAQLRQKIITDAMKVCEPAVRGNSSGF